MRLDSRRNLSLEEFGSSTAELVIIAPLLFILLSASLLIANFEYEQMVVSEGASAAAQVGVLQNSAVRAYQAASDSALNTLAQLDLHCDNLIPVIVDVSNFYAGGYIKVTINCITDPLGRLFYDPLRIAISGTGFEGIDQYIGMTQ